MILNYAAYEMLFTAVIKKKDEQRGGMEKPADRELEGNIQSYD